jgi:hypothetical protein
MKRMITAIATVGVLAVLVAPTPAFADLHGKGYETGDLKCGESTYTVLATGFGASFRVVDTTGVLVFRSGTLTNVATGDSVTFGQKGAPQGYTPIRCTGILINPVYDRSFSVEFFVSIVPG